jgi:hypothetical protein
LIFADRPVTGVRQYVKKIRVLELTLKVTAQNIICTIVPAEFHQRPLQVVIQLNSDRSQVHSSMPSKQFPSYTYMIATPRVMIQDGAMATMMRQTNKRLLKRSSDGLHADGGISHFIN